MKRVGSRGSAALAAAVALAGTLAVASPASASTISGAVGGLRNHAQGRFPLDIHATSSSANLADASLLVDGAPFPLELQDQAHTRIPSKALCDPAGSCGVGVAQADFDSTLLGDGPHHLRVIASDVDGNSAPIADQDFEVDNRERPYSPSVHVDLTIGSDVPGSPPGRNPGGSGGVLGGSATSCASPKLSMLLAQKPVRVRKGAVVLVRGKKYRFTGRLTCLVRNKRVSAPKKTKIQIFAIVKGRTAPKGTALVGSGGRIVIRLASPSARTLEFRFRNVDGRIARVRIKVQTVEPPRKHKHR